MVVVGLGTDIVEIDRIARLIERHGERFLERVYTLAEVEFCRRRKRSCEHFAGRWAAKEAVAKALGTGFVRGVYWRDIEVQSEQSGRPRVVLHGPAGQYAQQIGVDEVLVTISHCRAYATATALAVRF